MSTLVVLYIYPNRMGQEGSKMDTLATRKKYGLFRDLRRNRALYLLAVPGIIWFLIFCYAPMAGLVIAFKNYNPIDGIFGSPWNGLQNFEFLFKSGAIYRITFNTVFLNVLFIGFGLICQLGVALLLNEVRHKYFKKVTQAMFLLPFFISWVIVGTISTYLFGTDIGFINNVIKSFGGDPVQWYTSPQYWPAILTIASVWKGLGYGSIIYLAAIVGVDSEIYESAQLDGCNKWQLIRHITIPCILPTISIMLLLAVGRIFYGDFGMIYNMVKSNVMLYPNTDIIDTYVFRAIHGTDGVAGGGGGFSLASAAGLLQSVLGFLAVLGANKLVSLFNKDNTLF